MALDLSGSPGFRCYREPWAAAVTENPGLSLLPRTPGFRCYREPRASAVTENPGLPLLPRTPGFRPGLGRALVWVARAAVAECGNGSNDGDEQDQQRHQFRMPPVEPAEPRSGEGEYQCPG